MPPRTNDVRPKKLRLRIYLVFFAVLLSPSVSYGQLEIGPTIGRLPHRNATAQDISLVPLSVGSSLSNSVQTAPEALPVATMLEDSPNAFSVSQVLSSVDALRASPEQTPRPQQWWSPHINSPMRDAEPILHASVDQLIQMAMANSAQLFVYSKVPLIRQTAITEADSAFDWTAFVDGLWEDTDEPVGNSLTVGGTADRFKDNNVSVTAGVRRKTTIGSNFEVSQRIGHQNNNSTFFIPQDQGTSRLTLSFTQPLLRGRGQVYNTSLTVLAQIDTKAARDEFERQLETHLMEVVRGYWALYLERGGLTQKVKLYEKTQRIVEQLERRKHIDTQLTQLVSARAALAERTSDLVRSQAAVRNAETRIRGLLNDPTMDQTRPVEIIPTEPPTSTYFPFGLAESVETAVQNRSEVLQAIKQIRAGCVRLNMAKHEMMPVLNAVTAVYVSGLRGSSDVGQAWMDQFDRGAPSYSAGLQFEVPVWRRATRARRKRRQIELEQLEGQYRNSLETVKNEVEIAVREVHTSFEEMRTKGLAMEAASREADALLHRWEQLADANTSASLALESLLRSQERTTNAEFEFLTAQLTYNLSLMHMKRAMGILVNMDQSAY